MNINREIKFQIDKEYRDLKAYFSLFFFLSFFWLNFLNSLFKHYPSSLLKQKHGHLCIFVPSLCPRHTVT